MILFFITNSVELATFALESGADRIFVDLEIMGKVQRQGHLNTVISRHDITDVEALRPFVPAGRLLVRINPMHANSGQEIDQVIEAGADIIMLPMFHGPEEVAKFARMVNGRVRTSLLVETVGAMQSLRQCVAVPGIDEVHIGLNDLHLELGKAFMFEPLADGLVDEMASILKDAGIPFGIGGIARAGEGLLPAELILAEHARLGSSAAILSRTFHRKAVTVDEIRAQMDFRAEISRLRLAYQAHLGSNAAEQRYYRLEAVEKIRQIAASLARPTTSVRDPGSTIDA
jgi:hypothetical protein